MTRLEVCGYCHGTGRLSYRGGEHNGDCPRCLGAGTIRISEIREHLEAQAARDAIPNHIQEEDLCPATTDEQSDGTHTTESSSVTAADGCRSDGSSFGWQGRATRNRVHIYHYLVKLDSQGVDVVSVERFWDDDKAVAAFEEAERVLSVTGGNGRVYLLGSDRFATLLKTHGSIFGA